MDILTIILTVDGSAFSEHSSLLDGILAGLPATSQFYLYNIQEDKGQHRISMPEYKKLPFKIHKKPTPQSVSL
jgi:hypothetical protein